MRRRRSSSTVAGAGWDAGDAAPACILGCTMQAFVAAERPRSAIGLRSARICPSAAASPATVRPRRSKMRWRTGMCAGGEQPRNRRRQTAVAAVHPVPCHAGVRMQAGRAHRLAVALSAPMQAEPVSTTTATLRRGVAYGLPGRTAAASYVPTHAPGRRPGRWATAQGGRAGFGDATTASPRNAKRCAAEGKPATPTCCGWGREPATPLQQPSVCRSRTPYVSEVRGHVSLPAGTGVVGGTAVLAGRQESREAAGCRRATAAAYASPRRVTASGRRDRSWNSVVRGGWWLVRPA